MNQVDAIILDGEDLLYRCKDIEHITNIDLYKYTIILDEGRAECGVIILVNAIK